MSRVQWWRGRGGGGRRGGRGGREHRGKHNAYQYLIIWKPSHTLYTSQEANTDDDTDALCKCQLHRISPNALHTTVVYTRSQPDTSEPMIVLKILQFPSMLQLHTRVRAILWSVSSTVSSPHGMWPFDIDCNHKWRIIIRDGVPHNVLNFRNVYDMCVCDSSICFPNILRINFSSLHSSLLQYTVYSECVLCAGRRWRGRRRAGEAKEWEEAQESVQLQWESLSDLQQPCQGTYMCNDSIHVPVHIVQLFHGWGDLLLKAIVTQTSFTHLHAAY